MTELTREELDYWERLASGRGPICPVDSGDLLKLVAAARQSLNSRTPDCHIHEQERNDDNSAGALADSGADNPSGDIRGVANVEELIGRLRALGAQRFHSFGDGGYIQEQINEAAAALEAMQREILEQATAIKGEGILRAKLAKLQADIARNALEGK